MPGPLNRTRPGVTEGWWLGLTMCVTLTHIEDLLATTWSLVCEIRTPTQACQDRPHQEGHPGRWIPAVLAHHRAVAAMLALSVEGFFVYALHRVVWGHARSGEGGLRCSSAMFLMRRADG